MIPKELPVNFGINDMVEFDGSLHTYYTEGNSQTFIKTTSMTVIDPDSSCDNTMCIIGIIKKIDKRSNNSTHNHGEGNRTSVTRFTVSVQEGNERELYYCVAFKKQASDIAALPIGTRIFIQGKLAKRHFTDKNKNAKTAHEIYVRFYSPQWDYEQCYDTDEEGSND